MVVMASVVQPAWLTAAARLLGRGACVCAALAALWPRAGVAAGIVWQPPVEIARGGGEHGPWQQNASRFRFVDDPSLAWSPRGDLAVVWVDQASKAVLLRRLPASGHDAPVDVSRQPATFSWLPRVAWAPDDADRLHVLWQEIVFSGGSHGGEVLTAVSHDGGASFAPALNLSQSRAGDGKGRLDRDTWENGSLDIVAAPGGRVIVAWTEYEGRLWVARSDDGGRSYAKPLRVAGEPPGLPARAPALAVRGRDEVVLAWSTGEDAAGDIWVARSTDGGRRFEPARRAAATPAHSDAPRLAFDPHGVLHLVHHERRGGPPAGHVVLHARSTDGGQRFGMPQVIAGPVSPGTPGAGYPSLAIDAKGRVVVTFERLHGAGLMRSFGLGWAVSDDGHAFGAAQAVPDSIDPGGGANGSTQGLLMRKLALRADGEIAIVNSALKPGSHSRVWLMRGALR